MSRWGGRNSHPYALYEPNHCRLKYNINTYLSIDHIATISSRAIHNMTYLLSVYRYTDHIYSSSFASFWGACARRFSDSPAPPLAYIISSDVSDRLLDADAARRRMHCTIYIHLSSVKFTRVLTPAFFGTDCGGYLPANGNSAAEVWRLPHIIYLYKFLFFFLAYYYSVSSLSPIRYVCMYSEIIIHRVAAAASSPAELITKLIYAPPKEPLRERQSSCKFHRKRFNPHLHPSPPPETVLSHKFLIPSRTHNQSIVREQHIKNRTTATLILYILNTV